MIDKCKPELQSNCSVISFIPILKARNVAPIQVARERYIYKESPIPHILNTSRQRLQSLVVMAKF